MNILDDNPPFGSIGFEDFSKEALTQLQRLESGLLTLPVKHDASKLHELAGTTYTIKRRVSTLGWPSLETLAFSLERILKVCGQKTLDIDQDLHRLLLQTYLCLRIPLLAKIQLEQFDIMPALSRAKFVYRRLTDKLELDQALEEDSLIHISESRTEINGELLIVGLNQWMREVEDILTRSTAAELTELLGLKATILESMGEYFGFAGIVLAGHNMRRALGTSSKEPLHIAQHALLTLQKAKNLAPESAPQTTAPLLSPATPKTTNQSAPSPLAQKTHVGVKQFACLVDSVVLTLPCKNIAEIFAPKIDKIKQIDNEQFVYWKGRMLLVHRLLDLVDWLPFEPSNTAQQKSVLVLQHERQFLAMELRIERLLKASDFLVQPLSTHRSFCLGSTLLQENRLSFVVDGLAALEYIMRTNKGI